MGWSWCGDAEDEDGGGGLLVVEVAGNVPFLCCVVASSLQLLPHCVVQSRGLPRPLAVASSEFIT